MDEISKLLKLININSCKSTVILNRSTKSKEGQLIDAVSKSRYLNDNELAELLYASNANDVRYKMLKYRVKKKLYNQLILLDINNDNLTTIEYKEQECLRLILLAKVLYRKLEFELSHNLSNKAFKISQEYDFTELSVLTLSVSEACLAELNYKKEHKYFSEQLSIYESKEHLNINSQQLFNASKMSLTKSVKARKQSLESLPQIISQLKANWIKASTVTTFNYYYKLSIWYNELIGNFEEIIKITHIANDLVNINKVNSNRFNTKYNYYILVYSYLRNRDYEKGLELAGIYKPEFQVGTLNWFAYMENYFLLALHAKHYKLCSLLLNEVTENGSFTTIFKNSSERWALYREYLTLISPDLEVGGKNTNPFIMFLPEYSKDKQGFNVAILILQFIHYLQKRETEALLFRIESLKKYILTHLKDAFSLRSKAFLKLLILTVTEDYDPVATSKRGVKLYQKLVETPIPGDAYAEIEIVPYEHLWEHILIILESKYH